LLDELIPFTFISKITGKMQFTRSYKLFYKLVNKKIKFYEEQCMDIPKFRNIKMIAKI
jgi:hypothetical protein